MAHTYEPAEAANVTKAHPCCSALPSSATEADLNEPNAIQNSVIVPCLGRSYAHVSGGGMPGSGLPISATGIKNIAWPIAIVSVASACGS